MQAGRKKPFSPNTGDKQHFKELQAGNCCNLLCNVSHELCQQWSETSPAWVLNSLLSILSVLGQDQPPPFLASLWTKQIMSIRMCCQNPFPLLIQIAQGKHRWHSTSYYHKSHVFSGDMYDHCLFHISHVQKLILKNGRWVRGDERGVQILSLPLVPLPCKLLSFIAHKIFITLFEE